MFNYIVIFYRDNMMKLKAVSKLAGRTPNPINVIANVKTGASRWLEYANRRRHQQRTGEFRSAIYCLVKFKLSV